MMSKCGMQSTAKYVINVTSSVIYYCTDTQQHGMYLFCMIKKDVLLMVMSSMHLYFPPLKCVHYSAYHKFNLIAELKIYHLHSHEAFNTAGHSKQYV